MSYVTARLPGDEPPVAWKINAEVVVLLGWTPAILMQFAHPLVAAGVDQHSSFALAPRAKLRRLESTLDAMFGLTFGTPAEAHAAADRINTIHHRVHGVARESAGVFPQGTEYSAHDPDLLRWVHATLIDSLLRTYELFVGPLSRAEKDRYCAEAAAVTPLLGIPEGYLPESTAELERYMDRMMASGHIVVGETARKLSHELLDSSPFPRVVWPAFRFMRFAAIGLLRPEVRAAYGFGWSRRDEISLRLCALLVRRLVPFVPRIVRHWPAARAAYRRAGRAQRSAARQHEQRAS